MYGQGDLLRDLGLAAALRPNPFWRDIALRMIEQLPSDWEGTGEDIRTHVGLTPTHPNAWGGLINTAIKRGLIVSTGKYVKPFDPKSHSRKVQVYRRG